MKLVIVSDLHIDAHDQTENTYWPDGDVLVVAGDTSNGIQMSMDYIAELAERYRHVVTVDGNHEHWTNGVRQISVDEAIAEVRETLPANVHLLGVDNPHVEIEGVHFVGCNGWYSGNIYGDPEQAKLRWRTHADARLAGFHVVSQFYPITRSETDAGVMEETLDKIAALQDGKPVVMVTHTVPHRDLVTWKKYDDEWNQFNNYFVNSYFTPLLERGDITTWVFGHTHFPREQVFGNTFAIANPKGHSGENDDWKPVVIPIIM